MNQAEIKAREAISLRGKELFDRGLAHGSAGNISVRQDAGVLVTPTNSSLGKIDPADIAMISWGGTHISGKKPSKEAFLHLKSYQRRPQDRAVVHLHSCHSLAVSCLKGIDTSNVIPPLTAYFVMRIGKLPLIPYYRPGDMGLAKAVEAIAPEHCAVLLANHGPVVGGTDLNTAVSAIEELEETAKLFLLLGSRAVQHLTEEQIADLEYTFPRS